MKMLNFLLSVSIHRVQDLLCCAFEGGSNYWYVIENFHEPTSFPDRFDKEHLYKHIDFPTNPGGFLVVSDAKEGGTRRAKLDLKACQRGLGIMQRKYPHHFSNFLIEEEDAETGDVFLQCCIFGELVYG